MKRPALVWKYRAGGFWLSWVRDQHRIIHSTPHPTHAAALDHALTEVGLTTPIQHREPS